MLVGMPPYFSEKTKDLFSNIKNAPLKVPKTMSDNAKDLIKKV